MLLEMYFNGVGWQRLFLDGGCYWFANFISSRVPGSYLVINRQLEHCAVVINGKAYDILGQVGNKSGYKKANSVEISFMKKNYKPKFNVVELEKYLIGGLGER